MKCTEQILATEEYGADMDPADHLIDRKEETEEYGTDMDPAAHLIDRQKRLKSTGQIWIQEII